MLFGIQNLVYIVKINRHAFQTIILFFKLIIMVNTFHSYMCVCSPALVVSDSLQP